MPLSRRVTKTKLPLALIVRSSLPVFCSVTVLPAPRPVTAPPMLNAPAVGGGVALLSSSLPPQPTSKAAAKPRGAQRKRGRTECPVRPAPIALACRVMNRNLLIVNEGRILCSTSCGTEPYPGRVCAPSILLNTWQNLPYLRAVSAPAPHAADGGGRGRRGGRPSAQGGNAGHTGHRAHRLLAGGRRCGGPDRPGAQPLPRDAHRRDQRRR